MKDPTEVEKGLRELRRASQSTGCKLSEPFLQLAFLSLPVIPKLKLTDLGLVDVDQFKLIPVGI
jgi:adenine deaminase